MKKIILSTLALATLSFGADKLPDINNQEAFKGLTYIDVANMLELNSNEAGSFWKHIEKEPEYKNWYYKTLDGREADIKFVNDAMKAFENVCVANGNTFRRLNDIELEVFGYSNSVGDRTETSKELLNNELLTKYYVCENKSKEFQFLASSVVWKIFKRATRLILDVTYPRETFMRNLKNDTPIIKAKKAEKNLIASNLTPAQLKELALKKQQERYELHKATCDEALVLIKERIKEESLKGKTELKLAYHESNEKYRVLQYFNDKMGSTCPQEKVTEPLVSEGYKVQYPFYNEDGTNKKDSMIISW